ncbi:hypothetical protein M758_10G098100 [Ceratodon purpureus]|nr:hypothetical protein M758_10G098100 [Ceratodon purpureus]
MEKAHRKEKAEERTAWSWEEREREKTDREREREGVLKWGQWQRMRWDAMRCDAMARETETETSRTGDGVEAMMIPTPVYSCTPTAPSRDCACALNSPHSMPLLASPIAQ